MKPKIIGNLILEKKLGKGSYGVVFFTTLKDDKTKKLATKRISRDIEKNEKALNYFKNEIGIMTNLDHPNIAKFHSLSKTEKYFYLTMEYCNGGNLYDALEKYKKIYEKPFSEEIVQHFMRQIIDAFKYIHSQKIIHRDIKLENILINFESEKDKNEFNLMKAQIKIIDFGFSCYVGKSGKVFSTVGTIITMDPTILRRHIDGRKQRKLGYDQKADIWSLGTICYEILIGKPVFDSDDILLLIEKVENGSYTVPTTLSHEVVSFINGMLQYDYQKRLSCEELSRHPFLIKEVEDFKPIDLQKASKKINKSGLHINTKENKSIWGIFNAADEKKLVMINRKNALREKDFAEMNLEDLMFPPEEKPENQEENGKKEDQKEEQKENNKKEDKKVDEEKKKK